MKIEGFGQINPIDTTKVSKAQTEAGDFESTLQKAFDEGDKKKLREACNEFESIMLKTLYKQMKATVPDGGFVEKSSARTMFEEMLDDELMDLGSQRGMGISDMLYKQLSARMDRTYKVGTPNTGSVPEEAAPLESEADEAQAQEPKNETTHGVEAIEE
jgi:flagellar protein FlgJ